MMSESKFAPPLSFKLCIFLKTHFFRDGTFPSFFWEMFWPIFCSNLILQQCLDPVRRWSLRHFLDPTRTSFFDAGNPTRPLSFHGFSFSKNNGFHVVNPSPQKISWWGGKSYDSGSAPLLFPFFVPFNDLPLLTPPKLPNAQKVIGGRLQPRPARLRWPTKHTAGVHRSCWTPSLHSLKLGFSQEFMRFTCFFGMKLTIRPWKIDLLTRQAKIIVFQPSIFRGQLLVAPNTTQGVEGFVRYLFRLYRTNNLKIKIQLKMPSTWGPVAVIVEIPAEQTQSKSSNKNTRKKCFNIIKVLERRFFEVVSIKKVWK